MDSSRSVSTNNVDAKPYASIWNELESMTCRELRLLKKQLEEKQCVKRKAAVESFSAERKKFKQLKRDNTNRPVEMSSKAVAPRLRSIVPVKNQVVRDPRYDDLSGKFNETYFKQGYGFLSDIRQREEEKFQRTVQREKDPAKRQALKCHLTDLRNKEKAKAEKKVNRNRGKVSRQKEAARPANEEIGNFSGPTKREGRRIKNQAGEN